MSEKSHFKNRSYSLIEIEKKTGSSSDILVAGFIIISFLCVFIFSGGKRNESLILPINDSISGTLSTNEVNEKLSEPNKQVEILN